MCPSFDRNPRRQFEYVTSQSQPKLKSMDILAGDEANKLGNAFLHRLLGILSNLPIRGKSLLHDPADIRNRQKPILLTDSAARALIATAVVAATDGAPRSSLRRVPVRHKSSILKETLGHDDLQRVNAWSEKQEG